MKEGLPRAGGSRASLGMGCAALLRGGISVGKLIDLDVLFVETTIVLKTAVE